MATSTEASVPASYPIQPSQILAHPLNMDTDTLQDHSDSESDSDSSTDSSSEDDESSGTDDKAEDKDKDKAFGSTSVHRSTDFPSVNSTGTSALLMHHTMPIPSQLHSRHQHTMSQDSDISILQNQ